MWRLGEEEGDGLGRGMRKDGYMVEGERLMENSCPHQAQQEDFDCQVQGTWALWWDVLPGRFARANCGKKRPLDTVFKSTKRDTNADQFSLGPMPEIRLHSRFEGLGEG